MRLHPLHAALFASLLASAAPLNAADPASLAEAIAQGQPTLNVRARYENVDQAALRDAEALTLRTRLGFATAPFRGWKFLVEGENIVSPAGDRYNQSGLNPGGAGRAVVADPETTELNQAFAAWTHGKTTVTLGRQRLVLDNARFVGDVGWRQNQQTFDAFSLQDKSLAGTTLTYAYLDQVNRVFGRDHAQGRFNSDSHVLHAAYAGFKPGTVAAYAYLLDFANATAQSCATYGASFTGTAPLTGTLKLAYRAELATQSDYGPSPLDYSTGYAALELGVSAKPGALTFGYERLGGDGGTSFRTPLATLHAHNGWADLFLTTPGNGLRDTYLKASANLPAGLAFLGFYHWYTADRAAPGTTRADYGEEIDLQLARKFGPRLTATVKCAAFASDLPAFPDVNKFWLQLEFAY